MKKAIFLYDLTGIMALPWAEAGYTCYCFDGQHPSGVSIGAHPNILNVGAWFSNGLGQDAAESNLEMVTRIAGDGVGFVFGFPECTDLAVSGAAHFEKKRNANPMFQREATELAKLVEVVGDHYECPWGAENPVSVLATLWRKSDFNFNPSDYGGYLPLNDVHPTYPEYIKPRDAYPKKTCIWMGGGFVVPEKMPVDCEAGYSDQHKKLGGKSLKTKNIRSATPRGFAAAVFSANGIQHN